MTAEFDNFEDSEFNIPLCIFDLLTVCKEYSMLGWSIQVQIDRILDLGVEQAIQDKHITLSALPKIKSFLQTISDNCYFGEAVDEAHACIELINDYQEKHPELTQKSN